MSESTPLERVALPISGARDIKLAEDAARRLAAAIGFAARECEELVLAVAELGSNLVKHANGGTLVLSRTEREGCRGLRLESADAGPGIPDFESAVTDGYSTSGSLGTGLGTVNRLMDELEYHALISGGSRIVCERWLRSVERDSSGSRLEFGVATRAYRYLEDNGDAFVIRRWNGKALVGVIDGLGHGQFARRAAQTARLYVEQHYDQPLEALFRGAGRACQSTRGVVMALSLFHMTRQTFTIASVGNIEVRVFGSPEPFPLLVRRGVVGLRTPPPALLEHSWSPKMLLVMHSDGLRAHWQASEFPNLETDPAATIAQRLLSGAAKPDDDATVLVVRNALS